MEPTRTAEGIRLGGDARQRLHQARGYGDPVGETAIRVTPLEAAYLLYREDIPPVDGADFEAFVRQEADGDFLIRLLVYKDLRERGYYLSVIEEADAFDLAVFERGATPPEGTIGFRVRVLGERDTVEPSTLAPGTLALVDGEGEVGYVEVDRYEPTGATPQPELPRMEGDLLGDRVLIWDPPAAIYAEYFYGQPIAGRNTREGPLGLSLVEALFLAEEDLLALDPNAIREAGHGRAARDRFDARARVFRTLREAGAVVKTGFKFGADFRVYHAFEDIENMGHSDVLVRVLSSDEPVAPPALALDVRLAHGVGKRMVFARTSATDGTIESWLSVTRKTP